MRDIKIYADYALSFGDVFLDGFVSIRNDNGIYSLRIIIFRRLKKVF